MSTKQASIPSGGGTTNLKMTQQSNISAPGVIAVGFSPAALASLRQALQSARISEGADELPDFLEQLDEATLLLLHTDAGAEQRLRDLASWIQDDYSDLIFCVVGPDPLPESLLETYQNRLHHLGNDLDARYLKGLLDGRLLDRARMESYEVDRSRIQVLYDISSSLLKVSRRDALSEALDQFVPALFQTSLCLLVMPGTEKPLVYLYQDPPALPRNCRAALCRHLGEAWRVLNPSSPTDWEFLPATLDQYATAPAIDPGSFLTTPISTGSTTFGFFTILPSRDAARDESFLQTFFVVGDLLSVQLYTLGLKEELERRATQDGLTGLLNRQTVMEHLEQECTRARRFQDPLTVVMFDLDYFKRINDTYGHQAGDAALSHVAARLRAMARGTDYYGRFGGEEFLVILPRTDADGAGAWAARLREGLQNEPMRFAGKEVAITASFGIACSTGGQAEPDDLLARADGALYQAKRDGRNRVVVAQVLPKEPGD